MTVKDLRSRLQEIEAQGKSDWMIRDTDGGIVVMIEVLAGSVFLSADEDTTHQSTKHQPAGPPNGRIIQG